MRAPWNRAAALALAALSFSFFPFLSGCKSDVESQDEAVSADLAKATDQLESGDKDAGEKAKQTLQKSASNAGASKESQIEANSLIAQAEMDAADTIYRDIEQQQVDITALVAQLDQLAAEVAVNNLNISGYKALEPKAAQKALADVMTAAQKGSEDGLWVKGKAPVPSLADVKQRQEKLDGQIKEFTRQKEELSAKRAEALKSADTFDGQVHTTTGKDSVGFYIQASNQRKEAADEETRISQLDAQLAPLQEDLAVAQLQEKMIGAAVASFQQQSDQLQNNWQSVQKQIDATRSFSESRLNGEGDAAPSTTPSELPKVPRSMKEAAADLDNAVKSIDANRAKALDNLTDALHHYESAEVIAGRLLTELSTQLTAQGAAKLPERNAWQVLVALNRPENFKLRQAAVLMRLARLYGDEYSELSQRNRVAQTLSQTLKEAGLELPQAVASLANVPTTQPVDLQSSLNRIENDIKSTGPNFADDQQALGDLATSNPAPTARQLVAAAQANLAYAWADSLLGGVIESAPSQGESGVLTANLARAAHISDLYGWAVFARMLGSRQEYDARLRRAIDERKALVDANARYLLPTILPPGLEFPVTTQPTTAPAGGATTEPAPIPGTEAGGAPTTEPANPGAGPAGAPPTTEPASGATTQPTESPTSAPPATQGA